MADTIKFQCNVETTDASAPLGFEVLLDNVSMFKTDHVTDTLKISFDISDDEAAHNLQLVMTGKTQQHTVIDQQGNISSDAVLKLSNFEIDEIIIDNIIMSFHNLPYSHDFNGTQSATVDKFFGSMGCNGTVTFEFTTPFYLWLLENM